MDSEVTPVDRPCLNPLNAALANVLNLVRHDVIGVMARGFGDLERTLRLTEPTATPDLARRVAVVLRDGASGLMLAATRAEEAIPLEGTG